MSCIAGDSTRESLDRFSVMFQDEAKGLDMVSEHGQAQKWKLEAQQRAFAVGFDYLRNPTSYVNEGVRTSAVVRSIGAAE